MNNILIIGNSAAALNAVESFRKYDKESVITLVSKEAGPAYSRVLLPYYLRGKLSFEKMFLLEQDYYQRLNVNTYFGYEAISIDEKEHLLELAGSKYLPYDKLLIATGASPVMPPIENLPGPGVFHMWTIEDAINLEPYFCPGKRVLIIGSGFVALQAAWSALNRGMWVTVYELLPRIMPQVLDQQGAAILQKKIQNSGVTLLVNTCTRRIERRQDQTIDVVATGCDTLTVDLIIVAAGVCPNTALVKNSSVKLDRGILVDERMQTNVEGIYAAGDVAQGPTVFGEKHIIHALWPTAVEEGKVAGANMAGEDIIYQGSLNMNVTEMFGITVASMGRFTESEGERKEEFVDYGQGRYVKLVYDGDVLIGGIVLGKSEDAGLLGLLRPLIRYKKPADESTKLKIKSILSTYTRVVDETTYLS